MKTGVNTYGLAPLLNRDFDGTLAQLKEIGFSTIEPCILFDEGFGMPRERILAGLKKYGLESSFWLGSEAAEKIRRVRDAGFEVTGAHISVIQFIPGYFDAILPQMKKIAQECGLTYFVYCPMITSLKEMREKLPSVQRAAAAMKEIGVTLLFHNHESEFHEENGDCVFDLLMREVPDLMMEPDVGWVKFAGADVVGVLRKYKDRVRILHFKDVKEGAGPENRETCFTAVGEGSIPLKDILAEAPSLPLYETGYIIDQDASEGDLMEDLRTGFRNLNG